MTIRFTFTNSIVAGSVGRLPLTTHGFVGRRFADPRISRVGVSDRVVSGGCRMRLASNARVSFSSGNG